MGFFDLTQEDLQDGKAKWNGGETPTLTIASVQKKDVKGTEMIIIESIVVDGTQIGMKEVDFYRPKVKGSMKALGIFLTAFMTAQEAQDCPDPSVLINRKWSCTMVKNGEYVNARYVKSVSDVPTAIAQPTAAVAQPVAPATAVATTWR